MFEEYEKVKLKSNGKTGVVVCIDTDGETKPPLYFIEICQEEKTGNPKDDMVWVEESELEHV